MTSLIEKTIDRRGFLRMSSGVALSAGALALLGGHSALAAALPAVAAHDIGILNVEVALEYEGIAAYGIALKSGLLKGDTIKVATKFQGDHKQHNNLLISTIRKLGGEPVMEKTESEYAKALSVDKLKNQSDVLMLALTLELGAANAYLGVIPAFKDPQLARIAARIAADEATHWATLNAALGKPFMPALGFGA
ncbi:ferritin-like domain-containing protein [Rhodanobacter sp. OK091]|uniref:ferritin-like domain-containing protein n=1 Tax=Rhodanobacter sp. OK091 TaxID=1881037 RepID=UPI0009192797|nr:ferritin-like domain-containing protein [Rhodanobacter sp. OK091]SHM16263.1 Ferritin-like domain-containing protein [Rhodanobacter sp. OK091]